MDYNVLKMGQDFYICTGLMWIAADPAAEMYLKVHQRVTYVFHWSDFLLHIHCSNPYVGLLDEELFPDKIGWQSYENVQEMLLQLEEEMKQKTTKCQLL